MKKWFSIAMFGLLSMAQAVAADTTGTEKLQHFVKSVDSFQAHFQQTVIDSQGQLMEEAEGTFQLQRPGKFRWNYEAPYPQQIVADGLRIWFYDVDLEQVTVKSQIDTLATTPASLLSGDALPQDQYLITELVSEDGMQWVALEPKDVNSNFKSITLAFSGNDLQQMIMQDSFDQKTRLVFTQIRTNLSFDQKVFHFVPPAGVDVVGDQE